jgi:hypothetical protein
MAEKRQNCSDSDKNLHAKFSDFAIMPNWHLISVQMHLFQGGVSRKF